MRTSAIATLLWAGILAGEPVVIDRIAAIVGMHAIKVSDIDRDLRLTKFLNREPLNENADAKRQAAERLIDQQIIRDELAIGGYHRATDAEADAMLRKIRQERYGSSDARLREALSRYGLTEDKLRAQLLWQLTVLRFIDQRFRPGVLVTDEEVRAYYDKHPSVGTYQAVAPKIRESLEGERINQEFDTWLTQARKRQRVEFREGGLQGDLK